MKQALVFIAVFGVAFGITLLFAKDIFRSTSLTDRPTVEDPRGDEGGVSAKRAGTIERTMIPKDMKDVVREVEPDASSAPAPTVGAIKGHAKTDDGLEPRDLKVTVFPNAPEARVLGGGEFTLTDLQPGTYYIGVNAPGYLTRQAVEAPVSAGKVCEVTLWLERGFELSGTVVDDVEQRPIGGATIDFNGFTRVVSDSYGSFRTPIVPEKALDIITLTHDDFDRNVLLHTPIPEHQDIRLAMTRGKATLTGRVIPPAGHLAPAQYRVRLFSTPNQGQENLRRDKLFRDWSFEMRGVNFGPTILEVSFPDSVFVSRRVSFEVMRDPVVHVEIDFNHGANIEGTYTSTNNLVANIPILLVDGQNHPMGETRTDAKGKFRFAQAAEGEYAIRMDARIPPLYTQPFKVEDGKPATITVDGNTGLLR